MKKIKLCVITLMMVFLVACGKEDKTVEQETTEIASNTDAQATTEGQKTTEEKTTEATTEDAMVEPDETKMALDIDEYGGNVVTFYDGESYTLDTKAVVIDKASKEEKSFIVYCTATQENDMFTAENSYVLTYNFYEIGGWILDYCTLDTINMTPKCIYPKEEVESFLTSYGYTSFEYVKEEKISDTSYNYYYNAVMEYPFMNTINEVVVSCYYDNSYGWEKYSYINSSYNDWSKMYGTWYTEYSGSNTYYCTINIKNIDEQSMTITLDVSVSTTNENGMPYTNGQKQIVTTDIVAPFAYDTNSSTQPYGSEFYSNVPYYSYINEVGREVVSEYELTWGRNVGMYRLYCLNIFEIGFFQRAE